MAFLPYTRSSISNKLAFIVIISWLLIAFVITSFFVGQEIYSFRKAKIADVNGLARVISVNCTASLEFSDVETATEVLSSLSARPQIEQAAIYTTDANLFAQYSIKNLGEKKTKLPVQFPFNLKVEGENAHFFHNKYLDLYVPIKMDEKLLGTLFLRADFQDFSQKLRRTAFVVGGIMLGSLFFAWGVFSMLQRYISRPIQEMTEVMRRVRQEKKYSIRIQNEFTDELEVLADGFNSMLDHIQERDEQLLDAKQVAEEASRAKSQFLAQMSHEIRTPMNAIIGMTHLAIKSSPGEKVQTFLETVKNSADNLLGILNDILDFSKIEAGQLFLNQQPFLLRSMLETVISTMNVSAVEKGLKLQYIENAALPLAYLGDDLRLRQILLNLVGNAIKFTTQGTISIMVELVKGSSANGDDTILHFSVSDSGIGIAADKLKTIFNSFEQIDSSYVRSFGGTGLGLAISKQLTEMMGGRIWVESEIGIGSTFHFTVGLKSCEASLIPAKVDSDSVSKAVQGLNVLIVDDNEVNRDLARMVLENDHHVSTAITGLDALHALVAKPFDVILMDVQMPVMDGVETTKIIRAAEEGRERELEIAQHITGHLKERLSGTHISIIAMTAHALGSDQEMCIAAGMDGYITKPFQPEQLFAALRKIAAKNKEGVEKKSVEHPTSKPAEQVSLEQVVAFLHSTMRLNSEQMGKILTVSHKSLVTHSENMKSSLGLNKLDQFAISAHTIKGTLLQCGLSQLAKEAQALYENAKSCTALEQLGGDLETFLEGLAPIIGPQGLTKSIQSDRKGDSSKGRILVFDDDPFMHEVVEGMLTFLGYESEYATTSEETIFKYRESVSQGIPYDLVITDLLLQKGSDRKDIAFRILALNPKARLLMCSGNPQNPAMMKYQDYGFVGRLPKPFTLENLTEVLAQVM